MRVPYLFIDDIKVHTKQFQGRQSRFEAGKTAIPLTPRFIFQNPGKTAVLADQPLVSAMNLVDDFDQRA